MIIHNKYLFYLLSFIWGLPMTLVGCIVAAFLLMIGKKPNRIGYCYHFIVGEKWGGVSFGPVMVTSANPSERTKAHEHGHALQNCKYGPFMIIISIMSATRYWYRTLKYHRKGLNPPTAYDDVWYEGNATKIGTEFITRQNY